MAAWKSSSTAMKTENLPCPFCGSREAALRARVAELEQIVIASLKAAPVGYIPTHTAERLPEIIADMTTACREHSEEREQAEARVAELEAALREVEGDSLFPSGGAALRALREMAHDMDLLLELNAALKWETQWLAQGIRTQDEEHAMQIEHFAALKKDRERLDWLDAVNRNTSNRLLGERRKQGGLSTTGLVLSARVSGNADVFPDVLKLHVPEGSTIADVTHGKGVFWRKVDKAKYNLLATDMLSVLANNRLNQLYGWEQFAAAILSQIEDPAPKAPRVADDYSG